MGYEEDNYYPLMDPPFELARFDGGYFYTDNVFGLEANQSPNCKNVFCKGPEYPLEQMFGNTALNSSAISGAPEFRGLFDYERQADGTKYLVGGVGGKIRKWTTAWDDITGAYAITGTPQHYAVSFNSLLIGVTGAGDAPWKWTGSGDIAALGGSPPAGKFISKWSEFVCIGPTATDKDKVYYCDPGNAESGWAQYWALRNDKAAGVVAHGGVGKVFYIFGENTADRIYHRGGTNFAHDKEYARVGVVAPGTLQLCQTNLDGQLTDVLIGMGEGGIYGWTESGGPIPLSKAIKNKFDSSKAAAINRAYWQNACACYDSVNRWYILFIPTGSSTQNNEGWILDLDSGAWWPMSPQNTGACCVRTVSNEPTIITGGYAGKAWQWGRSLINYDGAAIDAYWNSKGFDFAKQVRALEPEVFTSVVGDYKLDFRFNWDFLYSQTGDMTQLMGSDVYGTGTYGTAAYGSGNVAYSAMDGLEWTGRILQVQAGNARVDETFKLHRFTVPMRILGSSPCPRRSI